MTKSKLFYQTMKVADIFLFNTKDKGQVALTLYYTHDLIFEEINGIRYAIPTLQPLRNN